MNFFCHVVNHFGSWTLDTLTDVDNEDYGESIKKFMKIFFVNKNMILNNYFMHNKFLSGILVFYNKKSRM